MQWFDVVILSCIMIMIIMITILISDPSSAFPLGSQKSEFQTTGLTNATWASTIGPPGKKWSWHQGMSFSRSCVSTQLKVFSLSLSLSLFSTYWFSFLLIDSGEVFLFPSHSINHVRWFCGGLDIQHQHSITLCFEKRNEEMMSRGNDAWYAHNKIITGFGSWC